MSSTVVAAAVSAAKTLACVRSCCSHGSVSRPQRSTLNSQRSTISYSVVERSSNGGTVVDAILVKWLVRNARSGSGADLKAVPKVSS